ncbi:hypothetical protein AB0D86_43895 [Streptomyces sp. NPDC048324]|uniref:hypothetical protein n=1 Tax=Streptomyces sp. NPDC048324 TaxID=3157205 RepID=UPI00341EA091
MQQLADEAHMKERTARENKAKLIKRNLIKVAERFHPKNGARIADLYRVNIDLLKQMQRKPKDYGPTLVEELTFDTPPENPSSDPPADSAAPLADSAAPPADPAPTPPADSAPLLPPSSLPSSSSVVAPAPQAPGAEAGEGTEEEEKSEKHTTNPPSAEAVTAGEQVADAWVQARAKHGHRTTGPARTKLAAAAARLIAQGEDVDTLTGAAVDMAGTAKWRDLEMHLEHYEPPRLPGQRPAAPAGKCKRHTWADADDCAPCRAAQRGPSEASGIAAASFLDRMRAAAAR